MAYDLGKRSGRELPPGVITDRPEEVGWLVVIRGGGLPLDDPA